MNKPIKTEKEQSKRVTDSLPSWMRQMLADRMDRYIEANKDSKIEAQDNLDNEVIAGAVV